MAKTSIGIDMGLNSIKMVELVQEKGSTFRLTKAVVRYSAFDWDVFEDKRAQALCDFIRKAREQNKLSRGRSVFTSMPSISVFVRYLDLLATKKKKTDELIALEAEQQIPMPLDEVAWDYRIVADKSRREKQAMLMAVKRDVVDESVDIVKKAGFVSRAITLSLLCLLNVAKRNKATRNAEGVIIVDIGAESSGILINRKKHIWLRSFSVGGKKISESIAENAGIDFEQADLIKREGPEALGDLDEKILPFVQETIQQNLDNLVSEVERSISFYKMDQMNNDASFDEELFKEFSILLTGGGSKINGLEEFFQERLGMNVSYMRTFEGIKITKRSLVAKQLDGISGEADIKDEVDPLLAVAVGAALEGFEKEGTGINFLKKDLAVQKSFSAAKFLKAASFIFFFSAFCVHFFFQTEEIALYKKHLNELEGISENVDTYGPQLTKVRKETKALDANGAFFMSFLQKRVLWLDVLSEITKALPHDVWLTNYQGTGLYSSENPNELLVQGITTSYDNLNAFIAALKTSQIVSEVKPESVVSQDDVFNFLLNLKVHDVHKTKEIGIDENRNS